jgi:hypothetical protein
VAGEQLIEEHIAPAELAQTYADAIQLRIRALPGRRLYCIPAEYPESAIAASPSPNWGNRHPASGEN